MKGIIQLSKPILKIFLGCVIFTTTNTLQAGDTWDEYITIDKYIVEPVCYLSYKSYKLSHTEPELSQYLYLGPSKNYKIKLSSKYKLFKNYSKFEFYNGNDDFRIVTNGLYDIRLKNVIFHNRKDVEFTLDENNFERLIKQKSFKVFYPSEVFEDSWKEKLFNNHISNSIYFRPGLLRFYSNLSINGLSEVNKECDAQISHQKKIHEERYIEESKPINRLKNFFGFD